MGFRGVLGHEFVGTVASGDLAGKRVVCEINCACRRCPTCDRGHATHCPERTVLGIDRHDGAFADQVVVPIENLHVVPDSISDDQAVLVEPLAAAIQILHQVHVTSTDRVTIVGDGRLGLMCAMALKHVASQVRVVGKHDRKLRRFSCREIETVNIAAGDPALELRRPDDVVVDCTGSPSGLSLALDLVRPRGTVVLKTTIAGEHQMSLARIVIDEINVIGSRCGPFAEALNWIQSGFVDLSHLITHRYQLHECDQAFAAAGSPAAFKVVFDHSKG